jgi:hypothetical protein
MPTYTYTTSTGKTIQFDPDTLDETTKNSLQQQIQVDLKKKEKESKVLSDTGSTGDEDEFNDIATLTGFRQAYYGSQKGYYDYYARNLYHTLANIPGAFLSEREKQESRMNIERGDNESMLKSFAKKSYDKLKDAEDIVVKKAEEVSEKSPDDFYTKLYAGVGAAPGTVAMYLGPIRALKSSALGIAAVDALSASDQGIKETVKAGVTGAALGKTLDAVNTLAPVSRILSLGAIGFGSPSPDLEQRFVNGLTFASFGAIGPLRGQQTFVERNIAKVVEANQRRKFENEFKGHVKDSTKNLSAAIDTFNLLQDKKNRLQLDINKLNKDLSRARTNESKIAIQNNINSKRTEIRSASASQGKLKPQLKILDDFLVQQETFVNNINRERIDLRSPTEFKLDAVKFDKETGKLSRKYSDIPNSLVNKYLRRGVLPREFMNEYPVFKKYVDEFNLYRVATEDMVIKILDNPSMIGKSGLTALKKAKLLPSDGGMIVRFNRLSKKEKEDLITKTFEIEKQYDLFSKIKKEDRTFDKFDEQGIVQDSYLRQLGFNNEQVLAYRDVMNGFEAVRTYYNQMAKQYGGFKIDPIPRRPNFFPHIFTGEYRVFVNQKGKLVEAQGTTTEVGAKLLSKKLKEQYPDATINYRKIKRGTNSDETISAFAEVSAYLARRDNTKLTEDIKKISDDLFAKSGFNIHKLPRQRFEAVKGFLGTKSGKKGVDDFNLAIKLYVEGAVKVANGFRLRKRIADFSKSEIRPGTHISLKNLYPESVQAGENYINNALGRPTTPVQEFLSVAEPGLFKKLYTKSAALANHFYLLQLNIRFALAQGIQPYQMIPNKLAHLSELSGKNSVDAIADAYYTVALMQKELIAPGKFSQELIKTAVKNRTINDSFLREFAGEGYYQKGNFADAKSLPRRTLRLLTGRALASNLEQFSRLNATLMFGHHLKRLGTSEKTAVETAWQLADKYMVRYDLAERPHIYNQLGTVGRAAGLFKTFAHNYHAQLLEGIKNAGRGQPAQLATLVASSIVAAGFSGALFVKSADSLIGLYNRLFDDNVSTLSMMFIKAGLPDYLFFGVPSATIGADLTATLAAPSVNPAELVSFPAMEFSYDIGVSVAILGDYILNHLIAKQLREDGKPFIGIAPTGTQVRDAVKKLTPNSLHGVVEGFYQKYSDNPFYIDKGNARRQRELSDWLARWLSSYSLGESLEIKKAFISSRQERFAKKNYNTLVNYAAENVLRFDGKFMEQWMFDLALEFGYTPDKFITSIKRRIKNMSQTLENRLLRGGLTLSEKKKFDLLNQQTERQTGEGGFLKKIAGVFGKE